MTKVLCLHGVGTNADILKAQSSNLRNLLPSHYEWHFIEGEEECAAAPGVADVFPPPYQCFHLEPSSENIQEALDLVDDIIESEGPFDAVMGFSQGGALAATVLVRHYILKPFDPPPFRVAIFICTHLPWSWDGEHGNDVTTLLLEGRSRSTDLEEWKNAADAVPTEKGMEAYLNGLPEGIHQRLREKAKALGHAALPKFYRFHPDGGEAKISIPTVHVCGLKDDDYQQSQAVVEMCDKDVAHVVEFAGGHEIPRDKQTNSAVSEAIQRAVTRAELMI